MASRIAVAAATGEAVAVDRIPGATILLAGKLGVGVAGLTVGDAGVTRRARFIALIASALSINRMGVARAAVFAVADALNTFFCIEARRVAGSGNGLAGTAVAAVTRFAGRIATVVGGCTDAIAETISAGAVGSGRAINASTYAARRC